MRFLTETGILLKGNQILQTIDGEPGSVEFDAESILKFFKDNPAIYTLAHSHPVRMYHLSSRDQQTLKTWAFTLYPYPVKMVTVALVDETVFRIRTYITQVESKESWLMRNKSSARKFEIWRENSELVDLDDYRQNQNADWKTILINKSYEDD